MSLHKWSLDVVLLNLESKILEYTQIFHRKLAIAFFPISTRNIVETAGMMLCYVH